MPVNYTWPELTAQGDYCILPQSSVLGDFKKRVTLKAFPQSTWNKILEDGRSEAKYKFSKAQNTGTLHQVFG